MTKFILFMIISSSYGRGGGVSTTQLEFVDESACINTLNVMINEKFYARGHISNGIRIEKSYCINTETGDVVGNEYGYNGKMIKAR